MKKLILFFMLALSGYALNAYELADRFEGNMISGHVVEDGSEANVAYASILVV